MDTSTSQNTRTHTHRRIKSYVFGSNHIDLNVFGFENKYKEAWPLFNVNGRWIHAKI